MGTPTYPRHGSRHRTSRGWRRRQYSFKMPMLARCLACLPDGKCTPGGTTSCTGAVSRTAPRTAAAAHPWPATCGSFRSYPTYHTDQLGCACRAEAKGGPLEPWDDSIPEQLGKSGIHTHKCTDHYHYWCDCPPQWLVLHGRVLTTGVDSTAQGGWRRDLPQPLQHI